VNEYLEFTFTFTSEMNFTDFLYQDFLDLNQSDPLLNISRDFVVVYSQIDNWRFKLSLSANLEVHFVDRFFCAIIKP
jgi:hypothetical protein